MKRTVREECGVKPTRMKSETSGLLWVAQLHRFVPIIVIAGCAGSMGITRPTPAATLVTDFDGSYRNTIAVSGTQGKMMEPGWCDSPGQPVITVANGHFSYAVPHPNIPGNATPVFQATMAQDGSFSGRVNDGFLYGHVHGTRLEGSIDGVSCRYAITGEKV
jgi:hypothetical protein